MFQHNAVACSVQWVLIPYKVTIDRGIPEETSCQEMAILPAGCSGIHPAVQSAIGEQQWVTGFHCVWSVVGWLIVYQLSILSLSCSQYSQTICWCQWDDKACLGVRNTSIIGAWPNSLDQRPPWYSVKPWPQNLQSSVGHQVVLLLRILNPCWLEGFSVFLTNPQSEV